MLLTLPAEHAQHNLCNARVSVRPSVCLSVPSAAGGFAAERPAGRKYQSIAAGAVQHAGRRSAANAGRVTLIADVGG